MSLTMRYLTHGTPGGYIDGCRCWSCRLGWLSAGRAFRRGVIRGVAQPARRAKTRENGQAADSSAAEPTSGVGAPGARPLTDTGGRPMATILPYLSPPVSLPRRKAVGA